MSARPHRIKRLVLEVSAADNKEARHLQTVLGQIQDGRIAPLLAQLCDDLARPDQLVRIARLTVDLGEVDSARFAESFLAALTRQLKIDLKRAIRDEEARDADEVAAANPELEALAVFARTGTLPWWCETRSPDIVREGLRVLLAHSSGRLVELLRELVREPPALVRLVAHLDDPSLAALVELLERSREVQRPDALALFTALDTPLAASPELAGWSASTRRSALWRGMLVAATRVEGAAPLSTRLPELRAELARLAGFRVDELLAPDERSDSPSRLATLLARVRARARGEALPRLLERLHALARADSDPADPDLWLRAQLARLVADATNRALVTDAHAELAEAHDVDIAAPERVLLREAFARALQGPTPPRPDSDRPATSDESPPPRRVTTKLDATTGPDPSTSEPATHLVDVHPSTRAPRPRDEPTTPDDDLYPHQARAARPDHEATTSDPADPHAHHPHTARPDPEATLSPATERQGPQTLLDDPADPHPADDRDHAADPRTTLHPTASDAAHPHPSSHPHPSNRDAAGPHPPNIAVPDSHPTSHPHPSDSDAPGPHPTPHPPPSDSDAPGPHPTIIDAADSQPSAHRSIRAARARDASSTTRSADPDLVAGTSGADEAAPPVATTVVADPPRPASASPGRDAAPLQVTLRACHADLITAARADDGAAQLASIVDAVITILAPGDREADLPARLGQALQRKAITREQLVRGLAALTGPAATALPAAIQRSCSEAIRVALAAQLPARPDPRRLAPTSPRELRTARAPRRPATTDRRRPALDLGFSDAEEIHVADAGLVILWPFLTHFLRYLGLTEDNRFRDDAAQQRAAALLRATATGDLEVVEYQLPLARVLCGLAIDAPIDPGPPVTEEEAAQATGLLQAVIARATILGEMSVGGLRGSFLLRDGLLCMRDGTWLLRVERRGYDVVLDRFPWGFDWVKLPWMGTAMRVEW